MDITNKKIYEKLLEIEKLLTEEKKEEDQIIDEEQQIKHLVNKKENMKFNDIIEWKIYVWDNCPYKKHDIIGNTKIGFMCDLTKKACDFLECPENIGEDTK